MHKTSDMRHEFEKLKLIFEYPGLYLTNYFQDLKRKVDLEFSPKQLQHQQNERNNNNNINAWQDMIKRIESIENECYQKMPTNDFENIFFKELLNNLNLIENLLDFAEENEIRINNMIKIQELAIKRLLFLNKSIYFFHKSLTVKLLIVKDEYISFESDLMQSLYNKLVKGWVNAYDLRIEDHDGCTCRQNRPLSKEVLQYYKIQYLNTNMIANYYDSFEVTLNNIEELNFYRMDLISIEENIFEGLSNSLIRLNMVQNSLTEIKANTFKHLNNLIEMNLAFNKIAIIDCQSFKWTPNLVKLTLTRNYISNISDDTFKELTNLEELELDRNEITEIDENTFKWNLNLKVLNLRSNLIATKITGKTFENQKMLQELNLSKNQIESIDDNSFDCLKDLRVLYLHENPKSLFINKETHLNGLEKLTDILFNNYL